MRPGRGWGGNLPRTTSSVVSYKFSDPRTADSLNTKILKHACSCQNSKDWLFITEVKTVEKIEAN
jgi:hypothetical protein